MLALPFTKTLDTITDSFARNAAETAKSAAVNQVLGGQSLIEFSSVTRVEPIVLVDQRVEHLDYMTDVLQSVNSIFAGYYLQAACLMATIDNVKVIRALDQLNPSRSPWQLTAGKEAMLQASSYKTQLPFPGQPVGLENYGLEADHDNTKELRENVNLSVGKLVKVTVSGGPATPEGKATSVAIDVNIRLIASITSTDLLTHILKLGSRDLSLGERYHMFKAGQIEFIRDLMFNQDLMDEHRKMLMKDTKGQYAEILRRRRNNGLSSVTNGGVSLATASNIVVISEQTRKEIERDQGIKFASHETRARIFDATYMMLLVVVDPEHQFVTIYHRGLRLPTELTIRQIKSSNKGTGPDITEILRAYQLGNSPSY